MMQRVAVKLTVPANAVLASTVLVASTVLASAIGVALPAQAQSTEAEDLQISAQDQQQNDPYSDRQLDGLANQINETADPETDSDAADVYAIPNVQGLPDNLVIIESGLDTSSPEDTIGDYAIGVSF